MDTKANTFNLFMLVAFLLENIYSEYEKGVTAKVMESPDSTGVCVHEV